MDVDRLIDRAVFAIVLCTPLLPAGPAYFGFEPRPWLQVAVLSLLALAVAAVWHRRARATTDAGSGSRELLDPIATAWSVFVAAVAGGAIVGLAAENDLTSPVFRYNVQQIWRLLWPVDHLWDPLYPLQSAFVLAQGLVVYAGVRALCLSSDAPRQRARIVLRGWAYGFGLVSAFAVFQYLTRFRLHPFWVEVNPELTRSHATLDDPNALGSYLVLGIFLCLGLAATTSGRRRSVAATLAALGAAALLASASRAAIGGLLLAGLAGATMSGDADDRESASRARVRQAARWLLAAGAVVLVISLGVRLFADFTAVPYDPDNVAEAVAGVLDPRIPLTEALEHRGTWWSSAARMWRSAPLLGVGLGRFPRLMPEYVATAAGGVDAHNLFLQVLAEMGVVGLLAFIGLLAAIFATLAGLRRRSDAPGARLAGFALLASVGYVATFATGHPLLVSSGQVLWATMLAAVVIAGSMGADSARADASPQRRAEATAPRPITAMRHTRIRRARLVIGCSSLIALYTLGAMRAPSVATHGEWGYSYGLYPGEAEPRGRRFRWTGGVALLQLSAPPDATVLHAEVDVSPALRSGQPTRVQISLDRNGSGSDAPDREDFNIRRLSQPDRYAVSLRIAADHRFRDDVFLRIEVEPTFVPMLQDGSDDLRDLGVRLFVPTFASGDH